MAWPSERVGGRILRRWGIEDPSRQQSLVAAGYLRVRRLLFLVVFLVVPPAVVAVFEWFGQPGPVLGVVRLFTSLIAALLLAETAAALRQVRGVRVAVLAPRSWRHLVPTWAIALLLGMAATALVLAAVCLAAQPWADRVAAALPPNKEPRPPTNATFFVAEDFRAEVVSSPGWLLVSGTVLSLAAVLGVVRLAVRRGTVTDPRVDVVLRARTARVVVGAGIGWLAHLAIRAAERVNLLTSLSARPDPLPPPDWLPVVHSVTEFLGPALLVVAVAGWIWVAAPPWRAGYLAQVA